MSMSISRRAALAAGAAGAGLAFGTHTRDAHASYLPEVWGGDFLHQWSAPEHVTRELKPGPQHIRLSCASYGIGNAGGWRPSYGEQIKAVRDAGYTACEASGGFGMNLTDSEVREIHAACEEYDVEFYGIHVWTNIIHPDQQQRSQNQAQTVRSIEVAERMGMKFILCHTGGRDPQNKDTPHPLNWTRETWEMSVAAVKQIIRDTAGSTVDIGFEAVNSCNNNTPKSHLRLKQDVGDDRVKVALDPTNMLYAGNYYRMTELLNQCFDLLGDDIVYAHAKDKLWRDMMPHMESVPLGEGSNDFATYLCRLSQLNAPRCLLIEHLPADQYPQSKKHLEDTAAQIGVKIYS